MSDQTLPGGDYILEAAATMKEDGVPFSEEFLDFLTSWSSAGPDSPFAAALTTDPPLHDEIIGRVLARSLLRAVESGETGATVIEMALYITHLMSRWQLYLIGRPEGHPQFQLREP